MGSPGTMTVYWNQNYGKVRKLQQPCLPLPPSTNSHEGKKIKTNKKLGSDLVNSNQKPTWVKLLANGTNMDDNGAKRHIHTLSTWVQSYVDHMI